jgi:hypothetical protein
MEDKVVKTKTSSVYDSEGDKSERKFFTKKMWKYIIFGSIGIFIVSLILGFVLSSFDGLNPTEVKI